MAARHTTMPILGEWHRNGHCASGAARLFWQRSRSVASSQQLCGALLHSFSRTSMILTGDSATVRYSAIVACNCACAQVARLFFEQPMGISKGWSPAGSSTNAHLGERGWGRQVAPR